MSSGAAPLDVAKAAAQQTVSEHRPALAALSQALHDRPEVAWEEYHSARAVGDLLKSNGFQVECGFLGLPTALRAVAGSGPVRIGLMAEYDAVPGIGHACGHNLIAAMSVGAALALAPLADTYGMTIVVYGTPAEEGGGGKIELLDCGAFTDLDLAMMAHPAPVDVAEAVPFAVEHWRVEYRGRAAHAAAFPTGGINAADAFTVAQVAIGLLRQHLPSDVRVHGVVTESGAAPNAIPDLAVGRWYVRAASLAGLAPIAERVRACFAAGAQATGCEVAITAESKPYAEFRTDRRLLGQYVANARALGREFFDAGPETMMARASTDMANVSHVVRAIHPYIGLGCYPVSNHQPEFSERCVGPRAERTLLEGAIALAWTALDAAHDLNVASDGSPAELGV